MKYKEMLIGPKEAMELLETNISNRGVKKVHLDWLVSQMKEDKWKQETGETIKISKSGKLLDGQHRLMAVTKSKKSFNFLVVSDLEEDVFTVLDSGVARSGGDALHVMGVKNAFNIAAMVRAYHLISTKDFRMGKNVKRINSEDILHIYEKDPEKWQLYNGRSSQFYIAFHRTLSQTFIGAWYKFLSENVPEKTEQFFAKLCLGVNIRTTNDPVGVYRDMLVEMRLQRLNMSYYAKNGHFINVWNAFIEGKRYKKSNWNDLKDDIPDIVFPAKK